MANLDWANINWKALASSNIMRGGIAVIVGGAVATVAHFSGNPVDPETQQAATKSAMQVVGDVADIMTVVAGVWVFFHRAVAQPETTATIVPKKPLQG